MSIVQQMEYETSSSGNLLLCYSVKKPNASKQTLVKSVTTHTDLISRYRIKDVIQHACFLLNYEILPLTPSLGGW